MAWHIDYLLGCARVVEVWYAMGEERRECAWFKAASRLPQAEVPVPGFGSSDCNCASHLIYFPSPPPFELFWEALGGQDRLINRASPDDFEAAALTPGGQAWPEPGP